MLPLQYKSKSLNQHNKVKRSTPKERREIARYMPVCWHCGQTKGLLIFRRADGRDVTLCEIAAKMEGLL